MNTISRLHPDKINVKQNDQSYQMLINSRSAATACVEQGIHSDIPKQPKSCPSELKTDGVKSPMFRDQHKGQIKASLREIMAANDLTRTPLPLSDPFLV